MKASFGLAQPLSAQLAFIMAANHWYTWNPIATCRLNTTRLSYRHRLENISMTTPNNKLAPDEEDRRAFLATCGRFAAVTPPALTMLLSTSLTSDAIAKSGHGNNGKGNGGGDGSPNGKDDRHR
jgi:hypothetical protein